MAEELIIKNTWRVVRQIGVGGMGTVYEVVHKRLGKKYALKQLKKEFEDRPDVARRFDREALTMAELQHDNIVQVYDMDVEPGFGAYILMDLINGFNLGKIIREQGPRPYPEVLRIGSAIASALDFAHAKGVVHRDIKPGNILIEEGTGRAVLTDFGIAKQLRSEGDATVDGTVTGTFVGTYRYSSPEQMRNEEPNARWDIYALGVVLYETYSGKRFLERMSEHQIVAHVAYVPDWKLVLDYPQPPPEAFGRVIEGCLERDPERRIASAAELGRRLEECRRETIRTQIGTQLDKLERLEKRMGVLGVPRVESRQMEALRARLSAIAERDAAGEHEEALDRLSSLWGQIGEAQQEQEASVREWFERGVAELRTRWQELAGRAGAFLPQPTAEQFEQLLDTVERAVADGEWERARSGLEQGRALPEQAEEAARRETERGRCRQHWATR